MAVDINSLVEKRRRNREARRKKVKLYVRLTLVLLVVIFTLLIKAFLKVEVNYNVKYNKEAIDEVMFVEDLNDIDYIRENTRYKYFVQSDLSSRDNFEEYSRKLKEQGIENYFIKEGKVLKLILVKGFEDINSAETFGSKLEEEGLLDTYTVRVR